ncbi:hypothetical protein H0H92_005880 [Tricholoma furcatifolium]|nr:hypothetical protein H0H92_005880 [Tricholoma furcatifolium]
MPSHNIKMNGKVDDTLTCISNGLIKHGRISLRSAPEQSPSISTQVDANRRHHGNALGKADEANDFSTDHDSAYRKLHLQRVISMENLLIFDGPGVGGETFGRRMDCDHAKKAAALKHIPRPESLEDMAFYAGIASANLARKSKYQWRVKDDVALEAVTCIIDLEIGGKYLFEIIENDPSLAKKAAEGPLSMDDLHWDKTQTKQPDFESRIHRKGERMGTLLYLSAEVLAGDMLGLGSKPGPQHPKFTHHAIHDMESLLWVLVHLCMIRKGPGMDMTRDELLDLDNHTTLHDALIHYFDGDEGTLRGEKAYLLRHPGEFEEQVVSHFHSYFENLSSLACKWWNIVNLGYTYRGKEFYNIHAYVVRIIDEAIPELPESTDDEDTKKELDRRIASTEHDLRTFKKLKKPAAQVDANVAEDSIAGRVKRRRQ